MIHDLTQSNQNLKNMSKVVENSSIIDIGVELSLTLENVNKECKKVVYVTTNNNEEKSLMEIRT